MRNKYNRQMAPAQAGPLRLAGPWPTRRKSDRATTKKIHLRKRSGSAPLTLPRLRADINALLARHTDLQQLHVRNYFDKPFDNLLGWMRLNPILLQKLTVLQRQRPREYDKSLFCGWLSALIAYAMQLETPQLAHAFIAGLIHDIGLLNVSPSILNKRETLTPEEWRAIQSHVDAGQRALASVSNLHPSISIAVLEHHERCDGSGYPTGKTEESLSVLGQIVAMADSMQSIRINQFEKLGRNMRDAMPYLNLNATIHSQAVYQAMLTVLKKSALQPTAINPFARIDYYVRYLLMRCRQLNKVMALLEALVQMTAAHKKQKRYAMNLWKVSQPVAQMIYSSGLLSDSFLGWLRNLDAKPEDMPLHELCEVELKQNELHWQLRNLAKSVDECLYEKKADMEPPIRQTLQEFAMRLQRYNREEVERIIPVLDRLCRFFNFRRKKDRETVANLLHSLDATLAMTQATLHEHENLVVRLKTEISTSKDAIVQKNEQIVLMEQTVGKLHDAESELRNKLTELHVENELNQKELQDKINEIAVLLQEVDQQIKASERQARTFEELQKVHDNQREELVSLRREHGHLANKFDLISKILAAQPETRPEINKFKTLFHEDFMDFADQEAALANEASAIMLMQEVMEQFELTAAFPHLCNKTIGAIGGGFSSGKSAFLNSFFQGRAIELPVGINPVTSLPCYVVASPESYINGHARNGGVIPIAPELFNRFTPEFLESFSFNLRDIMPMVSIGASLDQEYFQHICIIDTPGYNPSGYDGFRVGDKQTSLSQLQKASFVIWMIGLDTNGTIPKSDIDCLRSLGLEDKELFVVLNKADLKVPSERNDIMNAVEESLNDWDIPFAGISAYSASEGKEYGHIGISLHDFLKKMNKAGHTLEVLKKKVETVFSMYDKAISEKIDYHKKTHSELHSLKLDMLEMGIDDIDNKAHERIHNLQHAHCINELQEQLQIPAKIQRQFCELIDCLPYFDKGVSAK